MERYIRDHNVLKEQDCLAFLTESQTRLKYFKYLGTILPAQNSELDEQMVQEIGNGLTIIADIFKNMQTRVVFNLQDLTKEGIIYGVVLDDESGLCFLVQTLNYSEQVSVDDVLALSFTNRVNRHQIY